MSVRLVWAQSRNGIVGRDGRLPWDVPEDLAHFARLTRGAVVVMGHGTWDSLPGRYRPLPGRTNLVLSRTPGLDLPGACVLGSVEEVLARHDDLWVIGGAAVWRAFLPAATTAVVTTVDVDVEGPADLTAPVLDDGWGLVARDPARGWSVSTSGAGFAIATHERRDRG